MAEHIWNIQVLTPDFLISGKIDTEAGSDPFYFRAESESSQPTTATMRLTSAQIQPTGSLAAPDGSASEWFVWGANAFLALIPRDQASTDFVVKNNKSKSQFPVAIYVGPYVIRGKIWSPYKAEDKLGFIVQYSRILIQDARIDNLLPGAKLQGLNAPFAVVRTRLMQCGTVLA